MRSHGPGLQVVIVTKPIGEGCLLLSEWLINKCALLAEALFRSRKVTCWREAKDYARALLCCYLELG